MKNFLSGLSFLICTVVFSQDLPIFNPSTYYNTVNLNANVNANVNANINVNKNITTIDYGVLAQAEANREKTRLEAAIYADNLERQRVLEIASDPMKAFDYGIDNNWKLTRDFAKAMGIKKGVYYHKIPHKSLFASTGGYNYRNENIDGVIVEIEFQTVLYWQGLKPNTEEEKKNKAELALFYGKTDEYIKEQQKQAYRIPGQFSSDNKYYTHKNEISKAKVFGQDGFIDTWVFEDEYEYIIKDNYYVITESGWFAHLGARYKGDKKNIDFEKLEGRRFYFRRFVNQLFATANINDVKY
tara:strand:- start:36 stop:932 length:897 start_codon:yes stop_codon:yes gene_type:complete